LALMFGLFICYFCFIFLVFIVGGNDTADLYF